MPAHSWILDNTPVLSVCLPLLHNTTAAAAGHMSATKRPRLRQSNMDCPLLESGVLSVLLHHPALISSHSDICKLLCCSADLNAIIHAHCPGLVTLTATQRVPPDWLKNYAPLLRCLRINFSKMCAADRAAAEGSLASALQHASLTQPEKDAKLRLGEFVSLHEKVNVELLKRLPVASLTRLVFKDAPDKRHKDALHRKRHAKHHAQQAPAAAAAAPAAAAAAPAAAAVAPAAPAAPAAPVANAAAAAGGEPAAAAAAAAAAPAAAPAAPAGAEPAAVAPAAAAPAAAGAAQPAAAGAAPQAASSQQKKRKGHRPPRVTGLQELAATCRQLAGLREIEVTTTDGYADFLLPQLAFLKQLTSIKLDAVLSPNKALSTAAPKCLRALSLTFKSTRGNAQPQHKLDLSKCKMLSRLVLVDGSLSAGDVLPESLNHLQVGLCTSLQPLLPLQKLQCLIVTGKKGSGGDAFAVASQDLVQLRALTQLRLLSEALPPEACLPTRLVELHLDSLKDSLKQLTGLQCLTRLQVGLLDVLPSALEPLSTLTSLAHISASILFPPQVGAEARLAAVLRPPPDQDLAPFLERIVTCRLPFVELSVQGAVLDPRAMQLVGQCRHLTKLQLQGCKGRIGDSWPTLDPFRCLSDPISTWTQLQSLSFRGDTWRIPYPMPPGTRLGELSRAELDALCAGLDTATARSVKLDALKDKAALMTVQLLEKEEGSEATRAVAEAIRGAEGQGVGGTDEAAEAALRSAVRSAVPARAYERIGAAALDSVTAAAAAVGVDPSVAVTHCAAAAADAVATIIGHHTAAAEQPDQTEQAEQALAAQHGAAADAAGRAAGAGSSGASTPAAAAAVAAAAGLSAAAAAAPEAREMLAQAISTDTLLEWSGWAKAMAASVGSLTCLTHLDLSSWTLGESVTGLRPLVRLRALNLQGTSQSDFSLLGLLPRLGRLTELCVASNLEVTRAPLAAMELLLPELRVLNVRRCVLMEGDRGFKDWVAQHPGLTVVTTKSMAAV